MASDALTLKKYINKVKKKYLLIIIFINKITKVFKMDTKRLNLIKGYFNSYMIVLLFKYVKITTIAK